MAGNKLPVGRLFAELAVIVLGVLIALGFDNWNSDRADQDLEVRYLESLVFDLEGDSAFMANLFRPSLERKLQALRAVEPFVRGRWAVVDTLAFLDEVSQGGRLGTEVGMQLTTGSTFEELVSTGNLSLISDELRSELVSFHITMGNNIERFRARIANYPMVVHGYYPAELRGTGTEDDIRAFDVERATAFFTSDAFETVFNQEWNYAVFSGPVLEESAQSIAEMLESIRAELALHR